MRSRGCRKSSIVQKRNKRRALPSGRHVAGTKIGDGLDTGAIGDHRSFADLHRARDLSTQKLDRLAFVENRLPVGADQLDGFQWHAGLFECFGEQFAQQKIEPRDRAGVRRGI